VKPGADAPSYNGGVSTQWCRKQTRAGLSEAVQFSIWSCSDQGQLGSRAIVEHSVNSGRGGEDLGREIRSSPAGIMTLSAVSAPRLDEFDDSTQRVADWLAALADAAQKAEAVALQPLFQDDSHWRDLLALSGKIETVCGGEAIAASLSSAIRYSGISDIRVDLRFVPPRRVTRVESETIEAFFRFETRTGRGRGIVRLCPDPNNPDRMLGWTLLTALDELKGFEERIGRYRPEARSSVRDFQGPNWLDQRRAESAFADRDPAVLVVGAGQAGLAIAARLGHLGIDTLVVERHERVGDNWRRRYHALTLHNQVQVNHLPYMPFPPGWPTYIPKDKLANWFESYADAMELNVWTRAELTGGTYDAKLQRWTVRVAMSDGSEKVLHPRHLVMATGVSGIPARPDIPTLGQFGGAVLHASEYRDGEDWAGRRAIVLGTGNSGHDIAQDLHSSGAAVTLVQRSPTLVVNVEPSAQLPYALYSEGPSLEDCDLLAASMPLPLARKAHVRFTERSRELDKPLLDRLEAVGFRLDFGPDGTGWQFKYLTRGGGYYFNVGCSELVANGTIKLVQYGDIERFTVEGALLGTGATVSADLVVLATGYKGQEHLVAKLFGEDMAARIGPIWGFGDGMELRSMFCRTGQPGLWFIAGSLAQCRIYSKYLALQIVASESDTHTSMTGSFTATEPSISDRVPSAK
jgi:putative flavoprotein involved in K+ transport